MLFKKNTKIKLKPKNKSTKYVLPFLKKTISIGKTLKTKEHIVYYDITKKTLHIQYLKNINSPNLNSLKEIFLKIEDTAKKNSATKIECRTWMFAKHPEIKKLLGFEADNPVKEKKFIEFLEKHQIQKVKVNSFFKMVFISKDINKKPIVLGRPFIRLPKYHKKLKSI
jgi:hypothetical protein